MGRQILSFFFIKKFVCFTGVGAFATGLQYIILYILVQVLEMVPTLASGIGFAISALSNYLLNYHLTFKSRNAHAEAATKFVIIAILGLFLNSVIMLVGTEILIMHYLLAQVMATGIVLVWNFTGNYLWSFRERDE